MKIRRIPTRYLRIAKQKGTVALRDSRTGMFKGRVALQRGPGDTTKSRYLIHDVDLNRDGKIGPNEHGGQTVGRTVAVKASRTSRGYVRKI